MGSVPLWRFGVSEGPQLCPGSWAAPLGLTPAPLTQSLGRFTPSLASHGLNPSSPGCPSCSLAAAAPASQQKVLADRCPRSQHGPSVTSTATQGCSALRDKPPDARRSPLGGFGSGPWRRQAHTQPVVVVFPLAQRPPQNTGTFRRASQTSLSLAACPCQSAGDARAPSGVTGLPFCSDNHDPTAPGNEASVSCSRSLPIAASCGDVSPAGCARSCARSALPITARPCRTLAQLIEEKKERDLQEPFALLYGELFFLSRTCALGLAFLSQVLLHPIDFHSRDLLSQQHVCHRVS